MNDTAVQPPVAEEAVTAGTLLRRAREAAGIHVATLAVSLKVPVRKLEALEEDRYDQLSDAVFVRALASSVCRTLKIDPQPVLDRLPRSDKPRLLQAGEGINAPFRAPGDGPTPGFTEQLTRPVGLAVVGLLLAALVIILLPSVGRDEAPAPKAAPRTEPVPPPDAAASAEAVRLPLPAGEPTAAAPAPVASLPPAVAAPAPPASVPPAAQAPAPVVQDAAAQAPGVVEFRAKAPSWVQVVDARGNSVFRRLLEPGETASATGALPLTVTVGSVRSTEVLVRGKPFDLVPVTRDNVARFEVK
jgi:cytoskeleton protein RodZ